MRISPVNLNFKEPKLLIALGVFALATFLFLSQVISLFQTGQTLPPPASKKIVHVDDTLTKNSPLFTVSIFGEFVPVNLADVEIKQSMLDLEVVGILFAGNNNSQVIIRAAG